MATLVDRSVRALLSRLGLRSRYVETSVARHHLYDSGGHGDVVVCLPGLSDTATSWIPVVIALRRRGYRVLVVEGAGHGLSGQPSCAYTVDTHFASVTEVVDAIVDRPAVLVGNSLGGATALHIAAHRPSAVRAVFLTSPAGGLPDAAEIARIQKLFAMRSRLDATIFLNHVLHRPRVFHRLLAGVVRANASSRAVTELVASLRVDQRIDGLSTIGVPIRLVWGRSEHLLPADCLEWFRRELPWQAIVLQPDGLGHCPHLDDPLRLARMIHTFVESTRSPLAVPQQAVPARHSSLLS